MNEIKELKNFMEYLDSHNILYTKVENDNGNHIFIEQILNKSLITVRLLYGFEEANNVVFVRIRIFGIAAVENATLDLLKKINELNRKYGWYKILINDNSIAMGLDAYVDGNIINQLMYYFYLGISIADDIYPEIMRVIYS